MVRAITSLHNDLEPDEVLVDHVSFGSTLAMYSLGEACRTRVPGQPSFKPRLVARGASIAAGLDPSEGLVHAVQLVDQLIELLRTQFELGGNRAAGVSQLFQVDVGAGKLLALTANTALRGALHEAQARAVLETGRQ